MKGDKPIRKPRRRAWQRLCRAGLAVALLLLGAYVALPWWAPTGWLAEQIAARLSEQAGCDVEIGKLSLSWFSGIEIEDFSVSEEGRPVASVRSLRLDMAPMQILLYDELGIVRLEEPTLNVVVDAEGRTNLAPLGRLRADAAPSRILVERGTVNLLLPDEPNAVAVRVLGMEVNFRRGSRISLAGSVSQAGSEGDAPLSLSAQASPGGGAAASMTFSRLDLAALPIVRQTKLPLRRLGGEADGTLDLHVTRQGVVDKIEWRLRVRGLDVQPSADVHLPLIDEALLDVSAACDQITGSLRLDEARLRLPGVADLTCKADVGAGILAGQWQAVKSLDVSGQVQPEKLAAMLTGKRELSAGLTVSGAVRVSVEARGQDKMRLRMSADATAAEIRGGDRLLKPAGRLWDMGLAGNLDYRTTGLDVDESWLKVASNRFTGYGALVSLRRLAKRLTEADANEVGRVLISELAMLEWRGQWEIDDLPALADLAASNGAANLLGRVRIDAPVTGRWFIHHGPLTRVHATFQAAEGVRLRIGERFSQPEGVRLDLSVGLGIDPKNSRMTDMTVDLAAGRARLGVERLTFSVPDENAEPLRISGRFSAERIEDLLACLEGTGELRRGLSGSAVGAMSFEIADELRRIDLTADLRDTRISLGRWFDKKARQDARLELELTRDPNAPRTRPQARLACVLSSPWLNAAGRCAYRVADANDLLPALAREGDVELYVDAQVKDASRMGQWSPAVSDLLAGTSLSGGLRLTGEARSGGGRVSVKALCDATGLALASGPEAAVARAKPAGAPLTVRVDANVTSVPGALRADIRRLDANLARSRLGVAGWAEWAMPTPDLRDANSVMRALARLAADGGEPARFDLDANAAIVLDSDLRATAPEVGTTANWLGLSGGCGIAMAADGDANTLRMTGRVDANDLGLQLTLPSMPPALSPVVKARGAEAAVEFDLSCPADLSGLRIDRMLARTGGVQVTARGSVQPGDANNSGGWPKLDLRGSVSARRARSLSQLLPSLRRYGLDGGVRVDLASGDLIRGRFERVTVDFDKCRGRIEGKEVLADGTCILDGLDIGPLWPGLDLTKPLMNGGNVRSGLRNGVLMAAGGPAPLVTSLLSGPAKARKDPDTRPGVLSLVARPGPASLAADRVRCEGIEFRVGDSRGWVVADVSDIPAGPRGKVHVLASRLDVQEISDWLADPNAPRTDPDRPWKLTDPQKRRLQADANALATLLASHLAHARLDIRVSAERFRTFDQSVQVPYELRHVEFAAAVRGGKFSTTYTAGLNGGRLRETAAGDLTDANAPVACQATVEGLLAGPNIQPQLAKFFPGNTILGEFNKVEQTTAPLLDVLAVNLDARWPILRTGSNKTVAIEGVTEGRSAPEFVTKVFPGLNLVKYRYRQMTSFADMRPDGTVYNDMVFNGKTYDLYMEGTTDANAIGEYEIGLILLNTPESAQWNHKYRQGRIPILNFRARIEGGKLHDQEVSYLWPNEALFTIFLKNNIFYRIWLADGKNRP